MRRGTFQLQTLGTVHIGISARVNQKILTEASRIYMQLVGMAMAAAHAAAMKAQISRLRRARGAKHIVSAVGQCIGSARILRFRQLREPCGTIRAKIPVVFLQRLTSRGGAQHIILEHQCTHRQNIAGIGIVRVRLAGQTAIRLHPSCKRPEHLVHILLKTPGHFYAVLARDEQYIRRIVQHFTVIHRALLPLTAVTHDRAVQILVEPSQGQGLPLLPPEQYAQQKQPVILQNTPVRNFLEFAPLTSEVLPVAQQTVFYLVP